MTLARALLPAFLCGVAACGRIAADDVPSVSPSTPLGPATKPACVSAPPRPTELFRRATPGQRLFGPLARDGVVYITTPDDTGSTLYEVPVRGRPRSQRIGLAFAAVRDVFGTSIAMSWSPPGASWGLYSLSVFDEGTATANATPNPPTLPHGNEAVFDPRGTLYWTASLREDVNFLLRRDASGAVTQWTSPRATEGRSWSSSLMVDGAAVAWIEQTRTGPFALYRVVNSFAEAAAPVATFDDSFDSPLAMLDGDFYYAATEYPDAHGYSYQEIRVRSLATGDARTVLSWKDQSMVPDILAVDRRYAYWHEAEDSIGPYRSVVLFRTSFATGVAEVVFDAVDPGVEIQDITMDDCNVFWTMTGHPTLPDRLFALAKDGG